MKPDSRSFTRVPFERVIAWELGSDARGTGLLRNVSRGGFCVVFDHDLIPGANLNVTFGDILYRENPVVLEGKIAWRRSIDEHGEFVAGLSIVHQEPVSLAAVSEVFYTALGRIDQGVCVHQAHDQKGCLLLDHCWVS